MENHEQIVKEDIYIHKMRVLLLGKNSCHTNKFAVTRRRQNLKKVQRQQEENTKRKFLVKVYMDNALRG